MDMGIQHTVADSVGTTGSTAAGAAGVAAAVAAVAAAAEQWNLSLESDTGQPEGENK